MAKRILIVEDDFLLIRILKEQLQKEGFEITEARDGKEGLEMAKKDHPDMILLDLVLPQLDGIEVLRKIREDEWGKTATVIVLTNLSDNKRMAEAMGLGTYEYLVKGQLNIEDVILIIKNRMHKPAMS